MTFGWRPYDLIECVMAIYMHYLIIFHFMFYFLFIFCITYLLIILFVRVQFSQTLKTDSAQSSSNKCKNYLLKMYSQHGNFLNAV